MTIQEKQNLIKENKENVVAALNAYLDKMYSLTENYLNQNQELEEFLTPDEKVEQFVKELIEDEKRYESVRQKVIADDFNLSLAEIDLVSLSLTYVLIRLKKQKETIDKAIKEIEFLPKNLFSEDVN